MTLGLLAHLSWKNNLSLCIHDIIKTSNFSTVMILQTTAILVIWLWYIIVFILAQGTRNGKALDSVVDHKLSREIQFYGYTVSLAVILHYQPHFADGVKAYPSLSGHLILWHEVKNSFLIKSANPASSLGHYGPDHMTIVWSRGKKKLTCGRALSSSSLPSSSSSRKTEKSIWELWTLP